MWVDGGGCGRYDGSGDCVNGGCSGLEVVVVVPVMLVSCTCDYSSGGCAALAVEVVMAVMMVGNTCGHTCRS